jgi:hypothetical protein
LKQLPPLDLILHTSASSTAEYRGGKAWGKSLLELRNLTLHLIASNPLALSEAVGVAAALADMDLAYDHIQEEAFAKERAENQDDSKSDKPQASLNDDLQDAYKAFSASPWGAKIGGFLGNVVKQVGSPLPCRKSLMIRDLT